VDVPFDLKQIRVIYYDMRDRFWGDKLIAKVSENIVSALKNLGKRYSNAQRAENPDGLQHCLQLKAIQASRHQACPLVPIQHRLDQIPPVFVRLDMPKVGCCAILHSDRSDCVVVALLSFHPRCSQPALVER